MAGIVFQEPMTSLNPLHRIGRQVAEAITLHRRIPAHSLRARVIDVLDQAGFADAEHRLEAFPHQLSGGQRQRVMIAMALANDPALLIADEPTTALDVTIQAQILKLLTRLRTARGLALLLITHDLQIVRRYADRVCVMKDGAVVEAGRVADVFAAPFHPYTCMLLAAVPRGRPAPLPNDAQCLLQANDVKVHFPIRRGVLRRTVGMCARSMACRSRCAKARHWGWSAKSGSGKTTMALAALRLEHATGRHPLRRRGHRHSRPARDVQPALPHADRVPGSVRQSVAAHAGGRDRRRGSAVHEPGLSRAEREQRVAAELEEVGLPADTAHRYPHEFSGGQRQRIAIARAMVLKPRFVVLDEPTSALDMSVQAQIVELLRRLQQVHRLAYLFISHDLKVVRALAHRVVVLRHGRVVEQGDADAVFAHPREDYTRALMAAAFTLEDRGVSGDAVPSASSL